VTSATARDVLQLGLKDEAAIPEGLKTGCILPLAGLPGNELDDWLKAKRELDRAVTVRFGSSQV
jgi:hypothetical protein